MNDIEIIKPWKGFHIRYALFDFDGTISLIREGWQNIMIPYFCEVIRSTGTPESEKEIREKVTDFVDRLTGKQTIYQCIQLDDEVVRRGGEKRDPLVYKREYLRRLEERIHDRKTDLAAGSADPEEYPVPGSKEFIRELQANGVKCYLASGTDEADVLYEASLLQLNGLFAGGIHGARDEMLACSKELVIKDMLEREKIRPEELVSFGDGFVEIELVSELGGLAIGAATEEEKREGVNEWKRNRLISAGAYAIIPDFREAKELCNAVRRDFDAL